MTIAQRASACAHASCQLAHCATGIQFLASGEAALGASVCSTCVREGGGLSGYMHL